MTEELLGRVMLERARKEGHRPRMPEFVGRPVEYRRIGKGAGQRAEAEARYRALAHLTQEEVAEALGVKPEAVRRAAIRYGITFGQASAA